MVVKSYRFLIGMVDNDRTRQLFDEYFYSDEVLDLIWIDLGVGDDGI